MRASDYLGPTGPLARALPAYEHRPSQMAMADMVESVLQQQGVLLVEAGTGTGKTLAYLLPALLSGKKVVVSTGTKTLQDQIMEHDLPLLERHLRRPVDATSLKGLSNYLCLRRYEELRASPEAATGPLARSLPLLERWREETRTGDRNEETPLAEDAAIWGRVTSGTETRVGPKCTYYEQCFVTRARRRADEAQLVVVNHHLFFADLATRGPHGGGVLPDYDAVIFDEAHQIEDVATQFFGVQVSSTRLERLVRDAERSLPALGAETGRLVQSLAGSAARFFAALPAAPSPEAGRLALDRHHFQGELETLMHRLDSDLEALASFCARHATRGETAAQLAKRADQIRDDIARVAEGGDARRIAWTQRRGRLASIGASPVDVSDIVREEVFYSVPSVVLTSATLSTGGNFSFIKRRLGLDFETEEAILPSPFDYARQAALYVPRDMPDPRSAEFPAEAARRVVDLVSVTGGGAFVLSTSLRMMRELAALCRPRLTQPCFMQGEAPKASLLARFKAAGNAVLFATASFWEGVDVPGDALRLVVLDKLPFDVPSDPLVIARCDRLREEGEQPFMRYLVPSAALTLKQGFGRLLRGGKDEGIVALLDSRAVRKGYGKVLLRSLPDATRCETMEDVRSFWEGLRPPAPSSDGAVSVGLPAPDVPGT